MTQDTEVLSLKKEIESLTEELSRNRSVYDNHIQKLSMKGETSKIRDRYVDILKKQIQDMSTQQNDMFGLYSELLEEVDLTLMQNLVDGVIV
jgi:hypothetical protein